MKNLLLTFVLSIICLSMNGQISSSEKQILIDLYTATNGENWTNSWDLNTAVTNWHGIQIEDNKVTGISLLFNNMSGELPSSLGSLENLKVLELSFNQLHGAIPAKLSELENLKILAVNGNDLTGEIPASFGNLTNLIQLHLSSNKLTGEIPESLVKLTNLEVLNVFDNNLSGKIPSNLASSKSLKELTVAENNFVATNEFSALILSNGALLDLKVPPTIIPRNQHIIAIETEEEN